MPSEITGEKAARTKARSISLQTWIRPFWMTVSVTGSRFDMAYDYHIQCEVARLQWRLHGAAATPGPLDWFRTAATR